MSRFMRFLLLGLLLAPFITGCLSTRYASTIKKQDFQTAEGVKFNIKTVEISTAQNKYAPPIDGPYREALRRKLIMEEAQKAYPGHFARGGDAIPIDLEIDINLRDSWRKSFTWSLASLYILPFIRTMETDVELNIKVRGQGNELLIEKASEFRQESKGWWTLSSPLGLIPIPGKSDIPRVTTMFGMGMSSQSPEAATRRRFLRTSVVNSIVETLKGLEMQKVVASYKRSKRLAEAKRRLQKRLTQDKASLDLEKAVAKNSLVLMPLRANGVAAVNRLTMESAVASSLSSSYKVYYGKRVADKVREVYAKVTAEAKAGEQCDDTVCMQDIGNSFKSELVASANVVKNPSGYLLTLNISNVFDDVLVMSESIACKGCDEFQVIERLKTISDIY
ncbi:MAG: hypothetical protein IMF07_05260 [Proteobacteria bacterium]|nr:hypothetical protein [Pseudomonadota bacterium]